METNRLLNILEAVDNSKSISEIAKELFLSQSYISQVLKKYESIYKITLVSRDSHPICLTPAGKTMLHYLYKQNKIQQQMQEALNSFSNEQMLYLRLGVMPAYGDKVNMKILPAIFYKFPKIRTITYEVAKETAQKLFKCNKIDIYIGTPIHLENVVTKRLDCDKQYIIISKNSKIYQNEKFIIKPSEKELAKLSDDSFIATSKAFFNSQVNQYLKELGIHTAVKIIVDDPLTALKLTTKGLGNTVIGAETVSQLKNRNYDINVLELPNDDFNIAFNISFSLENKVLKKEILYTVKYFERIFENNILQLPL